MERSRREALASIAGVIAIAGCGQPGNSWAADEQSTLESDIGNRTKEQAPESTGTDTGSVDTDVSFEEVSSSYDADIYILDRDGQFSAVDETEEELVQADDLGRAINDAQATISNGRIVVATGGLLRGAIEQANQITISGIDQRVTLMPTEDVGDSAAIYRATAGTNEGQLESFGIDMQYRGGSAVVADGYTGLTIDDAHIKQVGTHGIMLSDGASVDIRNSLVEDISKDAVSMTNCSDVKIEACETTNSNHAVYSSSASNITITDVTARETEYSAFALQNYTTDWEVTGCTAVNSASTPFSASPALNGSFVDCVAEGTTKSEEGGFRIEYRADNDDDNVQDPVVGCSVESCTARDCNRGFYARENDAKYDTDTPIIRPRFIDCTAVRCDTGLFIDDNVEEAIVQNFDPVECTTDIVDNGVRTIIDGESKNEGDPSIEGEWFGHDETAVELDIVVTDTSDGTRYTATKVGTWEEV